LFAAHCIQNKKEKATKEDSESYFFFKNDHNNTEKDSATIGSTKGPFTKYVTLYSGILDPPPPS
jgi:hypothetical protein